MILLSVRLHPFAGISNKTYLFKKGLTVICGPNEEGKSTAAKAIRQVLFLETNLTPVKKQTALQHVWPIAGGDTVRITLEFSFNDVHYTLFKQWGPSSNTELKSADGLTLTDSNEVLMRITEMLPANQAVVEQVLIASQSQLADAVDKLSSEVQTSLSDQLRAAILKGGGISATQLEETICRNTESYFGRWDESTGTIQGGASRGLLNVWRNGVGHIASAWYSMQQAIEQEKAVDNYEIENNRLQAELNKCNESLKTVATFLQDNRASYEAVNKRIAIEGEIAKFQIALDSFTQDAKRWPNALAEQKAAKDALAKAGGELQELRQEIKLARQKSDAQKDLDKLVRINELNKKVEYTERTLNSLTEISETDVAMAGNYNQEIAHCKALIDGQKLHLGMSPAISGIIEITHSGGQSETINFLSGQQIEKEVSSSIAFEWQGVFFTIQSANEDIATLESLLRNATTSLQTLLEKYGHLSLELLKTAAEQYKSAARQLQQAESNLQAALGSDSLENLKARCEKVAELPGTRDIKVLEEIWERANKQSGKYETNSTNLKMEIDELEKKHKSFEHLDERRLKGKGAIQERESILNTLPPLPRGYDSASAFQSAYSDELEKQTSLSEQKHRLELGKQALKEPILSLTEAKEQTILAKGKFETTLAEGKAYRRIHAALQVILASADANAFQPLHQKTETYLQRLSGNRFKRIPFDFTQPQHLEGDGISLPISLLSKGTKDILALSLRLAAAEVYLDNNSGFVIMDDPLVDMDRTRREASTAILKDFSTKYQTVVFTCHEEHYNLLHVEVEQAGTEI